MKSTILKGYCLLILLLLTAIHEGWGQAGSTRVTITAISFCTEKEGVGTGDSEYRWKFYLDDQALDPCYQINENKSGCFSEPDYPAYPILSNKRYPKIPGDNGIPTQINLKAEMWENDVGGNCNRERRDDYEVAPTPVHIPFYWLEPGKDHIRIKRYPNKKNLWRIKYRFYYTPPEPDVPTLSKSGIVCAEDEITLSTNTYVNHTFRDKVHLYWQYWIVGERTLIGTRKWRDIDGYTVANVNKGNKTVTLKDLPGLRNLTERKEVHFRVRGWANNISGDYSANPIRGIEVDPPGPSFSASATQPSCTATATGEIKLNVTNGAGKYRYLIQKDGSSDIFSDTFTGSSKTIVNVSPGTYTIKLSNYRDNAAFLSACDVTQTATVGIVSPIEWNSYTQGYSPYCADGKGRIYVNVEGGSRAHPVDFTITGGHTFTRIGASYDQGNFYDLPAGSYTVTATDPCSGTVLTKDFTITIPPEIVATVATVDLSCESPQDGSVQVTVSEGPGTYDYELWKGRDKVDSEDNTSATAHTFENLEAGTDYRILVYDHAKRTCPPFRQDDIALSLTPLALSLEDQNDIACAGESGTLTLSASGGSGRYHFTLAHHSGYIQTNNTGAFTVDRGGSYTATVRNENATCQDSASIADISVVEPNLLSVSVKQQEITCSGIYNGRLTATVSGGTAPYTYQWQERDTGEDTWFNYTRPGAGTSEITQLYDAHYQLVVTDRNGCQLVSEEHVLVDPQELRIEAVAVQYVGCQGADDWFVMPTVSGGWGDYTFAYQKESQAEYLSFTEQTLFTAGTYDIRVTDAQGCQVAQALTIEETPSLAVDLPDTVALCQKQTLTLDATVAQGNYQWTQDGLPYSNEPVITVDQAGTYEVTVTNRHGCYEVASTQVLRYDTLFEVNFLQSTELYAGDTLTLTEVCYPLPDSVQWRYSTGAQVLDPSTWEPQVTFPKAGRYQVTLVGYYSVCSDSLTKTVAFFPPQEKLPPNARAAQGPQGIRTITVYPNPTTGRFRLEVSLYTATDLLVQLNDTRGQEVTYSQQQGSDAYTFDFDISRYASGQYFLRLVSQHDQRVVRIILQ